MSPRDQSKAAEVLRCLVEDRYGALDRGIEDRLDTIENRQRDIIQLLEIMCRAEGVTP